jgi:hypothetical protein
MLRELFKILILVCTLNIGDVINRDPSVLAEDTYTGVVNYDTWRNHNHDNEEIETT